MQFEKSFPNSSYVSCLGAKKRCKYFDGIGFKTLSMKKGKVCVRKRKCVCVCVCVLCEREGRGKNQVDKKMLIRKGERLKRSFNICECSLAFTFSLQFEPQISNRDRYSISNITQQLTICQ